MNHQLTLPDPLTQICIYIYFIHILLSNNCTRTTLSQHVWLSGEGSELEKHFTVPCLAVGWECKHNQTYILGPGPGPFLMFNLVGPPTCLRVGSYSLWLTFFGLLEWILLFYSCCPNFIHWLFLSWANPQSGHSQSTQHHASPCLHQVPESI